MDSMEEKELFERYGWVYDYIQQHWIAPVPGYRITQDELVAYNVSPLAEAQLRSMIIMFGNIKQE